MNQDDFERAVLALWMTTRIPLTRANLLYTTGAPRKRLDGWLDELVKDGVLEPDVDDRESEMVWAVRGAVRPADGPQTVAELDKLKQLGRDVSKSAPRASAASAASAAATALVLRREAGRAGGGADLLGSGAGGPEDKSLLASGLLGLVFGPAGWLYAGHWREAVPSAGAYILAWMILPSFLFMPLAMVVHPVSAIIGLGYAWKHNKTGARQKLLPEEPKKLPKP